MHSTPAPSVDCRSSEPPPAFPCRPCPTGPLRKSHMGAPADLIAGRWWLRLGARLIAVLSHVMCVILVSTSFESSAGEQVPARPRSIERFANSIAEASARFTVPARWIRAIIQIESAGDEHAISPRGAIGLMQLMPGTWVELSARYGLGADPFDAHDNIIAGAAYLKDMHDRFGSAGFLAAYYAGPARYEQHLATGRPLPQETTAYVAAVTPLLGDRQSELTAIHIRRIVPWREAPLFVERAGAP